MREAQLPALGVGFKVHQQGLMGVKWTQSIRTGGGIEKTDTEDPIGGDRVCHSCDIIKKKWSASPQIRLLSTVNRHELCHLVAEVPHDRRREMVVTYLCVVNSALGGLRR